MKKQFLAVGVIGASLLALTAKNSDPVLMNVAGKDVRLSEFEYLFHKNNAQQTEPQSLDQYVGMFVDYKLKVADAESAGIDTTASFISELTQFRDELSEPYLRDNSVLDSMVNQSYSHMQDELKVSHIMMAADQEATLDSLRQAIIDGKVTFEEVARQYSIDKPSARRGGLMGFVIANRYPWAFEEAAFETPVGQISPVVNSGFGNHIIRVESRQPARGEVLAEHILRLTRNVPDSLLAEQKFTIDSIYRVVKANPDEFENLAKTYSEDPGSARNGGSLGWFGPGAMVQEFDSVSFALPVGGISEPFTTSFGWHIIKKVDARGVGSLEDNRESIIKAINRTERGALPEKMFVQRNAKKYGARLNESNINKIAAMADKDGGMLDSAFMANYSKSEMPIFSVGGKDVTLGEIVSGMAPARIRGGEQIQEHIKAVATEMMNNRVLDLARNELAEENPDYRNLVNEYRDGILLFEISNRNVWDRAAKDKEGLEDYFRKNRAKYAWDKPKFKSYIIFTSNDSLLNEAVKYASTLTDDMVPADFTSARRERFGRDVKIERVIAAQGENAITDYLGFGGEKPAPENKRWSSYAAFRAKVITAPEEAADVRGAVVADYQAMLEKEWLKALHDKYPVKINKKVLKQVK